MRGQTTMDSKTAIVVLGYHQIEPSGRHGISDICRAGVRRAETLCQAGAPRAILFTGWTSAGGASEAEQMIRAWRGPDGMALLAESQAINTAENATRCLELLDDMEGVSRIRVVCSARHALRVWYMFGALYRANDLRVSLEILWLPLPSMRLLGQELVGLRRMRGDRRRARQKMRAGSAPLS